MDALALEATLPKKAPPATLAAGPPVPPAPKRKPAKKTKKAVVFFEVEILDAKTKDKLCFLDKLEYPHTVPADGAVGVEVEGHQAFWTCDTKPFILVLTTVPPHTDSLGVSTKTKAGLVEPNATIGEIKSMFHRSHPQWYPARQSIRLDPKGKSLKDEDVLQHLPVGTTATFYFRDLGAQISWVTVRHAQSGLTVLHRMTVVLCYCTHPILHRHHQST
ncbi:hypothetical protein NFI96_029672, partial [Prochilodus magdalenae]